MSTTQFFRIFLFAFGRINPVIYMLETIYRISVMYFVSIFLMRLAGKRAVAQLEVNELVTSFMVSEIACMPITDPKVKLVEAIVYSAVVILLEIFITKASIKTAIFKRAVVGKPDFLIINGNLDKKELKKADVSLSELVSSMRKKGVSSLEKINYAIQEPDGTISIFPYGDDNGGLQHMLICDGKLNKTEMEKFGYSEKDVLSILRKHKITDASGVFYLGVDDNKKVFIIKR